MEASVGHERQGVLLSKKGQTSVTKPPGSNSRKIRLIENGQFQDVTYYDSICITFLHGRIIEVEPRIVAARG